MSNGLNKVQLIGNLGKDPEMRFLATGNAVTSFSMAVNRSFKRGEQRVEETEWVNIVAFGTLAETLGEYVSKGRRIYIEGRLRTEKWQDREGVTRWTTKVVATDMLFLDSSDSREPVPAGSIDPNDLPFEQDDEDLPFE